MNILLKLSFLFYIGSIFGWVLELFYRRFFSKMNPERKWINPGFLVGPYVPLYGFGLCVLYLLYMINSHFLSATLPGRIITILLMGIGMTVLEYVTGIFCLKYLKVRLWDYTNEKWNLQGLICPKFSVYWTILCAVFYYFICPYILESLDWLAKNLTYCFVIGFFYGVFTIDVVYSARLISKMKEFAEENDVIVRYERMKSHIRDFHERASELPRIHFILPFHSRIPLSEHLANAREFMEKRPFGKNARTDSKEMKDTDSRKN